MLCGRRLALSKAVRDWSLCSVQVKLIKMGGRPIRHAAGLVFQLSEAAAPREVFPALLQRIGMLALAPA